MELVKKHFGEDICTAFFGEVDYAENLMPFLDDNNTF